MYRKTHSVWQVVGVTIILALLPIGDTVFNRWYHQNTLCTRDDVGLRVFERVKLPPRYYDNQGRFKEPNGWFSGTLLLDGRYQKRSGYTEGGAFPFTAYERRFSGVFDVGQQRFISYEADYWAKGGGWWLVILRPMFPREDYLTYIRGIVNGPNCAAVIGAAEPSNASINAAFEGR